MSEQFANLASSTLAAGYTAGSGSISVASATSFPTSGTFTVVIRDQTTKAIKLLFRVTSVAGNVLTGASEGADAAANSGDLVDGTMLSVAALTQIKTDAGGGGGNTNSFGTTANLPSTAGQTKGNRYVPTDSLIEEYIFDGTLWQPFVRGLNVVTPATADFPTVVTGTNVTPTFQAVNGGVQLIAIKTGGIDNVALRLKTFTAGKAYTMRFYANVPGIVTNPLMGIAARDSGTGKFYLWGVAEKGNISMFWGTHWTNENSFAGTDYGGNSGPVLSSFRGPITVRFRDDGTNYLMEAAIDGVNFETYFTVTHGSAFLTPNQVGMAVLSYSTTQNADITVCDFFQT